MATNADAQRLGFITPADTDLISEGDDAISQNARAITDLFNSYRMNRGTMPANSDVDTFHSPTHSGLWHINSAGVAAGIVGLPPAAAGQQGEFLVLQGGTGVQLFFPYGYYGGPFGYVRRLMNVATKEYSPWEEWMTGAPIVAAVAHSLRQTQFIQAMGGPIDTGGRAVVSLRFDHGLANFRDKVLPAVKARGIKVSQAYNPRRWHLAENTGVTAADLNGWVAAGDVEIWNHSATHIAAENPAALRDEIVNGLAEIEAELPAARGQVWGFAPPGFTGGDYMGFNDGRTPEGWDTYAGRLILQHHAVASGYLAGTQIRPLDGTPRDGQSHYTIDAMTVADLKGHIDAAIAQRGGLQLMLHPSQLDTAGKMTTAQFIELLDYIVAKRTAGELMTLSPYQMMVADSTRPPATVADVTGLADRLAAIEYDSGRRNVSSLIDGAAGVFLSRVGRLVLWEWVGATFPSGGWRTLCTVPTGFRPIGEVLDVAHGASSLSSLDGTRGSVRITTTLTADVTTGPRYRLRVSYFTADPIPATLPGDPA